MTLTAENTIKPLGARVLLRRLEADELSPGGIVIPDKAKEKPQEAEVLDTGPGGKSKCGELIPIPLKQGDRVLVSKYGGTEVKRGEEKLVLMNESDVLAVVEQA